MEIQDRIERLRERMEEAGIDLYIIPTADCHDSEYVGAYFKCREYITGFTGSAGTAVISRQEACLWTDGRYFVQAAIELQGTGVRLMKMGEDGVPTVEKYVEDTLPKGGVLGFDGRVIPAETGEKLELLAEKKGGSLRADRDLAGEIWKERPPLSAEPAWILEEAYAGESAEKKLERLRKELDRTGASAHILTVLDDIAWLLNIRGNDIPCNPVALAYFVMTGERKVLFIQKEAVSHKLQAYFDRLGVETALYDSVYDFVRGLRGETVLMDKGRVNTALWKDLDPSNKIISRANPCTGWKAVKNPVEMENIRRAHRKDGVAVTKFIHWLKTNIGTISLDEAEAAERLEGFRKEQEGYIEPSFDTISAYGSNAAMCHYSAQPGACARLEAKGLYLTDSGGQYYEGTTDITRTVALGELTQEERLHFTLTVIAMLRLGAARFRYGCSGIALDHIAREPFWQRGLDFNHGTGHGVGYLLNVHEGPNGFRWRTTPAAVSWILEEGMLTSDEPGIYIEGSHGIRTENLMFCRKEEKTEYGQFMGFEFVTLAPIDLDALDLSVMEDRDVALLNAYHRKVWEQLSPYMDGEEKEWLRSYTREVKKAGADQQIHG